MSPSPSAHAPSALRLGVDLGGTKIAASLLAPDGSEVDARRTPTPSSYDELMRVLRDFADAIAPRETPLGLGMPGSVSPSTGRVRNANLQYLNGRDFPADLAVATGRQVRVANDADCFTLSEATDGAAAAARVVFGVIIGTGVGGGITVDGALLPGAGGTVGEWGHNPLPWPAPEETPGPACWCGQNGCIERWVAGTSFEIHYRALPGADPEIRAPEIVRRAERGDPAAAQALDAYVSRLGRGLASICNVIDPAVIVLGGGMSNVDVLYERLPDAISPWLFTDQPVVRVVKNRWGDASGLRGAAWLWSSAPAGPGR
ncbi:MAG: ROK family protein [Caulobacteraceae bacterium]|nr:ROK family protein [Caulobacter sp.]